MRFGSDLFLMVSISRLGMLHFLAQQSVQYDAPAVSESLGLAVSFLCSIVLEERSHEASRCQWDFGTVVHHCTALSGC